MEVVDLTSSNDGGGDEGEHVLERLGVRTAQPSEIESRVLERMEDALIDAEQKKIDKLKQRIASLVEAELSFRGRRLLTRTEERRVASISRRKADALRKLEGLEKQQEEVRATMACGSAAEGAHQQSEGSWFEEAESDRGRMIRTGQITPFSNMHGFERRLTGEEVAHEEYSAERPSFRASNAFSSNVRERSTIIRKRRRPQVNGQGLTRIKEMTREEKLHRLKAIAEQEGKRMQRIEAPPPESDARIRAPRRRRLLKSKSAMQDDGNEDTYKLRMEEWKEGASERRQQAVARRREALQKAQNAGPEMTDEELDRELANLLAVVSKDSGVVDIPEEVHEREQAARVSLSDLDSDDEEDQVEFDGGYRLPAHTYYQLFEFQQTGVKWMWELYCLGVGGIIADEMGLGKTIQSVAFLAGLYHSGLVKHPSLVICPATVMNQWVREFHKWWPPTKVCVLHSTGRYAGSREALFKNITRSKGVIVTSYGTAKVCEDLLLEQEFQVVFLDEGHKIKNPNAAVTLLCKQLKSPHRLILTGAPIQNNLIELWSLFDFVFPGKLGTLPVFETEFAIPITMGGYANASKLQVQVSYKCAVVLRDLINPYLLRRMKDDVDIGLPSKKERVLFCPLQVEQVRAYQDYLKSEEVRYVLSLEKSGNNMLKAVMMLRKICNHPDLVIPEDHQYSKPDFGDWSRSGKMRVIQQLLPLWRQEGHRVLWFTQTRRMLRIMERFARDCGYSYLSMDGNTSIGSRAEKIDSFNDDPSYFLFLLTTRTGGLGINLTGADRVIIFDPDWNPSTDSQARERAWRIGQKKEVAVYRLITSGTVEEKIYQRQIYKQFLTNKILKDPRQKRFFHSRVMKDLLTLQLTGDRSETGGIFAEIKGELVHNDFPVKRKRTSDDSSLSEEEDDVDVDIERLSPPGPAAKRQRVMRSDHKEENSGEAQIAMDLTDPKVMEKLESAAAESAALAAAKALENSAIDEEEMDEEDEEEEGASNEDNILAQLFSSKGIKSVLEHDAIMDQPNPDHMFVENEATMVAQRAARLLKTSKTRCDKEQVFTPTWTGKAGTAGGPPPPGRHSKRKHRQDRFGRVPNTRLQQFSVGRGTARDADKAAMVRNFQSRPGVIRIDQASAPVTWSSRSVTSSSHNSSSQTLFQVIPSDVRAHAAAMAAPSAPTPFDREAEPKTCSQSSITQFFKPTASAGPVQPMSSSSILQSIRERVSTQCGEAGSNNLGPVAPDETLSTEDSRNLEHIKLLHSYLLMEGGEASSNAIIRKFGVQLISREAKFVFRSMLKEIASFDKESQRWRLKPSYR